VTTATQNINDIKARVTEIYKVRGDRIILDLHPGQTQTWESTARFPVMLSGSQGGKTSFGPHWLKREIEICGPGDYLAVTASFPLLKNKMILEFLRVFVDLYDLGTYKDSDKIFEFYHDKSNSNATRTRVIFASAANPESIESATAKAAWLDELGQKQFRLGSWEAINRRLAIHQGRALITTTPYGQGWQKQEIYDRHFDDLAEDRESDFEIIQFDSTMNPSFAQQEFERARRLLPAWKFNLFYRGRYDKPTGLVYDCFEPHMRIPRLWTHPPEGWMCYVGHDFGPNNTAALWFAQNPHSGVIYVYREYLKGGNSSGGHAANFIELSQGENIVRRVGGSAYNEQGYRDAFGAAGWPIIAPSIPGVNAGIDRVYGWFKSQRMFVFNDLRETLDDLDTYSYQLDSKYQVTEEIADKQLFHCLDAMRYALTDLRLDTVYDAETTPVGPIAGSPGAPGSSRLERLANSYR
jgi:hypothetical protein